MSFHDEDLCLANSVTMHIILKEKKYFEYLTLIKANVTIISGSIDKIKGSRRVNILLPNNTKQGIKDALYSHEFRRNLLGFKDIHANDYHIKIIDEDGKEYLYIISHISSLKLVLEKSLASLLEFIIRS
jgi:hypothetical protein